MSLTRQRMQNSLFMGAGTRFLRQEAQFDLFQQATGGNLNSKAMRNREFVNRFCAFRLLGWDGYHGDMDQYLANCLREMNQMSERQLQSLSDDFRRSLKNNLALFGRFGFWKYEPGQERRSVLNASL